MEEDVSEHRSPTRINPGVGMTTVTQLLGDDWARKQITRHAADITAAIPVVKVKPRHRRRFSLREKFWNMKWSTFVDTGIAVAAGAAVAVAAMLLYGG